jgi:hypothetical protein
MSIAQTDDRAPARDSRIRGFFATFAAAIAAVGAAFVRRRRERPLAELPLSAHLRRDIGLPVQPSQHTWREG